MKIKLVGRSESLIGGFEPRVGHIVETDGQQLQGNNGQVGKW